MNADNIKVVLGKIHLAEITLGRAEAYKQCITGSGLSLEERQVLMKALHLDPNEVGETIPEAPKTHWKCSFCDKVNELGTETCECGKDKGVCPIDGSYICEHGSSHDELVTSRLT